MNIYEFLKSHTKDNELTEVDKHKIIGKFIEKFIDQKLISQYILLWNSVKEEYRSKKKMISIEKLNTLSMQNSDDLYIYLERHKKVFKGSIPIILLFLEQQEPWEDTDITIFDESCDWFIAFTHDGDVIFVEP